MLVSRQSDQQRCLIVVGDDAVADAPLEVGLRVGLDEGVDGSDDAVLVTSGVDVAGSDVRVATDAHRSLCTE